jgi:hypothetical protein
MSVIVPKAGALNKDRSEVSKKNLKGNPTASGAIAGTIGTGDDAKNSIIWITIRWSFIIGSLLSLAIYLRPAYCQKDYSGNLIEDIKATWTIFMPVITLALGYIFGKSK